MSDRIGYFYTNRRHKRNMWIGVSIFAFVIFILLLYYTTAEEKNSSLLLVHLVFRHGDRTPTETYKNDPYKNYNWPNGWGALTKKGKLQMFELGRALNSRYKAIIDNSFSINDISVRSSDSDRCHMSAGAFLAGMFPPTSDQIWNPELLWQPIPIRSLPRNNDNIIAMKKKCYTYDEALKNAYNSEPIQKLNEENKELYNHLTECTGQNVTNITAVEFLYNTLEIEEGHGLSLPSWTQQVYPEKMKTLAARSLSIFTETQFMMKMKGGVLLKEFVQHIERKSKNLLSPDRKIFLYSGHDITLVNLMRTLGFVEDMKPEYGATFVLEAHSSSFNHIEIRVFYYDSWSKEPRVLPLKSCGEPCYFDNFVKAFSLVIPDNWDKECEGT